MTEFNISEEELRDAFNAINRSDKTGSSLLANALIRHLKGINKTKKILGDIERYIITEIKIGKTPVETIASNVIYLLNRDLTLTLKE